MGDGLHQKGTNMRKFTAQEKEIIYDAWSDYQEKRGYDTPEAGPLGYNNNVYQTWYNVLVKAGIEVPLEWTVRAYLTEDVIVEQIMLAKDSTSAIVNFARRLQRYGETIIKIELIVPEDNQ
jgi:hypothetical protein